MPDAPPPPALPAVPLEDADETRRLTQALSEAAARLVLLREEGQVYSVAGDVLAAQGFNVMIAARDGDELALVLVRDHPETIAAMEQASGLPLHRWRRPYGVPPEFTACMDLGRAVYRPDAHAIIDTINPPPLAAIAKRTMPRRAVEAPFFLDGRPAGFITAFADGLTPASAAVVELFARVLGAALENVRHHRRAEERMRLLSSLQSELLGRERLATVGQAAAVLSHEVRNPLGALLNGVALLKRDPPEPVRRELLGVLEEELHRIDGLVGDLQQLARPMEPRRRSLDLGQLVRDCVARQREPSTFELRADAPVEVEADPLLLGLAVENLLRNASQASPAGAVVQVEVASGSAAATVAVEDRGPGVPDDEAARIFQPFFTTRARGTGLGLAIVKRVLEAHGGSARVTRGAAGGARFELALPRG